MNHIFVVSLACLFCVNVEASASASEVGKNQIHTFAIKIMYNKQTLNR
jgi:hypothetical protein